jgi:uncharacterized protein
MIDRLKGDLQQALRRNETLAVSTLRMLIAQLQYARIELKRDPNEEEALALLQRAVKTRRDAIELYDQGGRKDLADKERAEIAIVQRYLPAAMTPAEVQAAVDGLLAELGLGAKQDLGRAMKEFMARYRGRVDGKTVNALIAAWLK